MDKKTLYVARWVKNWDDLVEFAKAQWLTDIIDKDDFHVTIAFSRDEVDWDQFVADTSEMTISIENAVVEKLGDAIVIKFESKELEEAWQKYIDGWASWDHDGYLPHISLSYNADQSLDGIDSFSWDIELWPEVMDEVDEQYLQKTFLLRQLKKSEDHKTVTFVVLEPFVEDRNGDVISEFEIVRTAHEFFKNSANKFVNIDHQEGTEQEGVYFVESFILPMDLEVGDETIVAWSWLVAMSFADRLDLYDKITSGEIVGISMEWYIIIE